MDSFRQNCIGAPPGEHDRLPAVRNRGGSSAEPANGEIPRLTGRPSAAAASFAAFLGVIAASALAQSSAASFDASFGPAGAQQPTQEQTGSASESQPESAAEPASQPASDESKPATLWESDRLLGDWGGARTWLEERGLTVDLGLTAVYQHNAMGGVNTHNAHTVAGSYDLELSLDTATAKLWKGGKLYAYAAGSWDAGVSGRGYVGDLFGVNWDAVGDRSIDVWELWYEQSLLDGGLRLRAGKIDLRTDFDTNAFANDETVQFLNTGLVNTINVPFPDWGQGAMAFVTPAEWLYFGAGIADAEADYRETGFRTAYHGPSYFFSIYELGLTPTFETPLGKLPGGYRVGVWYDPQPKEVFFDDLDGRRRTIPLRRDDVGFYGSFDQLLFRENPADEKDEQGLGLFARYGFAHAEVNEIEHFWSIGGQYRGLIPSRDADVLGFGVAQGALSDELRKVDRDPFRETAIELYYNAQLAPWLTLSPDFQWILRPGGENGRDAFVAGLRLQLTF